MGAGEAPAAATARTVLLIRTADQTVVPSSATVAESNQIELRPARPLEPIPPHLPVLLYTGLADRIREPSLPANMLRSVLRKPIDHGQLSRIVDDVLADRGARDAIA